MPDSLQCPDFPLLKHKLDPTLLSTAITSAAYMSSRTYVLTLHQDPAVLEQEVLGKLQKEGPN